MLTELQPFIDRRLLTTDTDTDTEVVIGVAHEAFLFAWSPLNQAITAAATALRARREIDQAARQWNQHGRAPARLWERGQLAAALADTGAHLQSVHARTTTASAENSPARDGRWPNSSRQRRTLVADRVELSSQARDFLRASLRRDRIRRGRAITILSMLLILALGLAVLAFDRQGAAEDQQRVAEARQRLATARQLLAQAQTRLDQDPRTALRLNEAAVHIQDNPETRSALVNNVLTTPYTGALTGHDGGVLSVAFAPGGNTLASAGADGTVRLWNTTDPAAPTPLGSPLTGHTNLVESIAFAPDGDVLASASWDGTVRLWDTSAPAAHNPLGFWPAAHDGWVKSVAFNPGGDVLASAGADGTVRLWNTTNLVDPTISSSPLNGHTGAVESVALNPDGNILASAGEDGTVRLWDIADPAAPTPLGSPLTGHTNAVVPIAFTAVRAVAFDPDGDILASAGADGTVRLWNLTHLKGLRAHAMEHACAITDGGLDRDEWARYVPSYEYVDVCPS